MRDVGVACREHTGSSFPLLCPWRCPGVPCPLDAKNDRHRPGIAVNDEGRIGTREPVEDFLSF